MKKLCYHLLNTLAEIAPSGHFSSLRLPRDRAPTGSSSLHRKICGRACKDGLAKTVNLIYFLQKVIFGVPDGPDPPDGAGTGAGVRDDQAEAGSPGSPAWPVDHFYV